MDDGTTNRPEVDDALTRGREHAKIGRLQGRMAKRTIFYRPATQKPWLKRGASPIDLDLQK